MKAFDPNYKLLDEMYQDDYYPAFLVDKVKDELQKVIDLLESGETDTEVVQETLDEAVCGINDLQEAVSYTHLDVYKRQSLKGRRRTTT